MLSRTNALNHPSISSVLSSAGTGSTSAMAPTSRPTAPVKPKPPPQPQPGPQEKPRGRAARMERPPCRRDPFMQTIDYRSFDPCELRHRLTTLDAGMMSSMSSTASSSQMDKESKSPSLAVSRVHSLSRANSIGNQARALAAARNHQRPRKPLSDCILASLFGWTSLLRPRKKQELSLSATTSLSITAG